MTTREKLESIAKDNQIDIYEQYLNGSSIKGLYCDDTILLNMDMEDVKKNEVLSHELGHHFTLPDNEIFSDNSFHEFVADAWSYKTILPIHKLITYYIENYSIDEILEDSQVSLEFLESTMQYYKDKYGLEGTIHDNYVVKFFPYLHVYEIGETFDYDDL